MEFYLQHGLALFSNVIYVDVDVLFRVLTVTVGVLVILRSFVRRKLQPTAKGDTILLAHTLGGSTQVIPTRSSTTPAGLYLQYLIGASLFGEQMQGVYSVELPFRSGVHLLGIPKAGEDLEISMVDSAMEPIVLEGDYPNYFSLYADKGQGVDARFVLDPKAMLFTVDFCKEFSWEIVDDSLYFASDDKIVSFEVIDAFVANIRPSIEVSSERAGNPQLMMPYAHFEGRKLKCPVCDKQLSLAEEWLGCPDGHGVLVTASQLSSLRNIDGSEQENKGIELDVEQSGNSPTHHLGLTCPYCHSPMSATQFAFTKVEIDVCSRCMFRWLDAGEAKRLFVS